MKTLEELFLQELSDMRDAENRILAELPRLAANSISPELESFLNDHVDETKRQLKKLDSIFDAFQAAPVQRTCEITVRLLHEADILMTNFQDSLAMDAAIIFSVLQVKHHEIASYTCLFAWAKLLENCRAATLLHEMQEDAQWTASRLSKLNEEAFDHDGASLSLSLEGN